MSATKRGRRLREIEEEIQRDHKLLEAHMREVAAEEAAEDAANEIHDPSLDKWLEEN